MSVTEASELTSEAMSCPEPGTCGACGGPMTDHVWLQKDGTLLLVCPGSVLVETLEGAKVVSLERLKTLYELA